MIPLEQCAKILNTGKEKYDKEKPVYIFKTEDGKQKEMGTSSKKFAKKMMAVVPGSIIQVI